MNARRKFLAGTAAGFFGATVVSRVGAASLPEAPVRESAEMAPPLFPKTGGDLRESFQVVSSKFVPELAQLYWPGTRPSC